MKSTTVGAIAISVVAAAIWALLPVGVALANGEIVAWGNNNFGQCNAPSPSADFIAVAAGESHSLGLKADGSIVAWGNNENGQCNVPSPNADFIAVAAGSMHSLGLKANGSIVAWGYNGNGQCNVGLPNTGYVAVSAGTYHSLGLRAGGSIEAWGYNGTGALDVASPNSDYIAMAAGVFHSLGLKADGTVAAWGSNTSGQCDVPLPNRHFVAVAARLNSSSGLIADGSIVAWGENGYGQADIPAPNADFVGFSVGYGHIMGLKAGGSIVAWGFNDNGQGNVPLPNAGFAAVAAGAYHSLALKGEAPSLPIVSCSSLQVYDPATGAYDPTLMNVSVTVEGIVYVAPGTYSDIGGGYLQDETGGINFWRENLPTNIHNGDRIRITGSLWPDGAELYVGAYTYAKLDSGLVVTPTAYSVSALLGDFGHTGSRVWVRGTIADLTEDSFWLEDGGDRIEVRRSSYAGIDFSGLSEGASYSVISPCLKAEANLYLKPARQADIVASVHYVGNNGDDENPGTRTQPFRTIQRAVDAALSGDEVVILNGVYSGPGNVNISWLDKDLSIGSESSDPQLCVMECAGEPGFIFADTIAPGTNEISFSGLTIIGAATAVQVTGGSPHTPALFESAVDVGVSRCIIRDGSNGVILQYAQLEIESTTIMNNQCSGISASADGIVFSMSNCTIANNGGGCLVYSSRGCDIDVEATEIVRNGRGFEYGCDVGGASFRHCRVDSNSAGSGIEAMGFITHTSMTDCSITGNARNGIAYGRSSVKASLYASRCRFSGNGEQGIATFVPYADLRLSEVLVVDNLGWGIGPNIGKDLQVHGSPKSGKDPLIGVIDIHASEIRNNSMGGIDVDGMYSAITVDNTTIADNGGIGLDLATTIQPTLYSLTETTIANNAGHGISASASNWTASQLLVANNSGAAIDLLNSSTVALSCSDLYGNLGGDWTPPIVAQAEVNGNFSADPYFCGLADSTYAIAENSPCAPGNHPIGTVCGKIGAWRVGCGVVVPPVLAQLLPLPAESGPVSCGSTTILGFRYTPGAATPALRGYSVRVVADGPVTYTTADFTPGVLPVGAETYFRPYENAPNDFTVDFTILGGATTGIATEEDLFSVTFHGAGDGVAGVHITQVDFRDLDNQPFPVEHTTPASIIVDCGPPPPVTAVTAVPGHHKVALAWTDPEAPDLAAVTILRGMWRNEAGASAYPLYGLAAASSPPARPDSLASALAGSEWTVVADVAPGTGSFTDEIPERGIYFYEVFAIDAVGNASAHSVLSAQATNYWLGDVAMGEGDGYVNIFDMSALGDSYGVSAGHPSFSAVADVGPTDTANGDGMPLPDGLVAFDDLMIFSQNFGEVGPAKSEPMPQQDLKIVWRQESGREWSCHLAQACADLRGLRVTAGIPAGARVTVTAGPLLSRQAGPVFLKNAGADLDVGLCLMGRNLGFEGEGELFRIVLTGEGDLGHADFEARSVDNKRLALAITSDVAESLPVKFAAGPSFPNPFNATTTIQFDLPEPQRSSVTIYSLDGRQVRTLLSQDMAAGRHAIQWDGKNERGGAVASGTYFCRIEAGPYRATQKMVLAK